MNDQSSQTPSAPAPPARTPTVLERGPAAEPPAPPPPDAAEDPLVGDVLDGRYRIVKAIGRGGMGTVYAADHTVLNRRVAVKVLRSEYARAKEVVTRFVREARAVSAIGHPNIISIFDFGTLPSGELYFVMELPDGVSVDARLNRERPLPIALAVEIARQVALGVQAAHRRGIVHRDLKTENVIVWEDPNGAVHVKVLDFGIALAMGPGDGLDGEKRVTQVGMVVGTPEYMSPEQAAGETIDHRTDIYALGVMLYEMLCGRPPFMAPTVMGILSKQMHELPAKPSTWRPELSPALDAMVLRALAKDREHRYANADEMATAMADALAGKVIAVEPAVALVAPVAPAAADDAAPASPPARSRRRTVAVVALAGVLLAATTAIFSLARTPPTGPIAIATESPEAPKLVPIGAESAPKSAPPASLQPEPEPAAAAPSEVRPSPPPRAPVAKAKAAPAARPVLDPEAAERRYREGREALMQGRFRAAAAAFGDVVSARPNHAGAYRGLGMALAEGGDAAGARRALRRYLSINPGASDAATVQARLETLK